MCSVTARACASYWRSGTAEAMQSAGLLVQHVAAMCTFGEVRTVGGGMAAAGGLSLNWRWRIFITYIMILGI